MYAWCLTLDVNNALMDESKSVRDRHFLRQTNHSLTRGHVAAEFPELTSEVEP